MENKKIKPKDCKIFLSNFHNSCENSSLLDSKVKQFLLLNGYVLSNFDDSNLIIYNTCVVYDSMINNQIKKIDSDLKEHPKKDIIIIGCLAGLTNIKKFSDKIILIKSNELEKLEEIFESTVKLKEINTFRLDKNFREYQEEINKEDYFVKISHGCSNNCTYCNIKLAKGNIISKSIDQIINEIIKCSKKEVCLIGDDCGSYGHDIGTNIAELIDKITKLDIKIKIYNFFPGLFIKYYPRLRKHIQDKKITYICVPLQSGSQRILKLMNRNYDLKRIKEILKDIKKINQEIKLYSHFIVNFPTESIKDFNRSIEMAKLYDQNLFLKYEDNKNTAAYDIMPKCTENALKQKHQIFLNNKICGEFIIC